MLIGLVFTFLGWLTTREYYVDKAVQAGVAEWQVDPKTGETFFVYKKP